MLMFDPGRIGLLLAPEAMLVWNPAGDPSCCTDLVSLGPPAAAYLAKHPELS
jgi:hypothetical protein